MLITEIRILTVIVLGFLFAYLYGFIEHGYIPPAEHLRLRFFNHFANYHITMFGLFSALPLVVLAFQLNLTGMLLSFGLWAYLPLGEDWTSWGGGYRLAGRWIPKWYLVNLMLATMFFALALALAISR